MTLALEPADPAGRGLRRLARRQLRDAIRRIDLLLDEVDDAHDLDDVDDVDASHEVHEIRKRCKEVRAIARLASAAGEGEAAEVDRRVRAAAAELGASRDAVVAQRTATGLVSLAGEAPAMVADWSSGDSGTDARPGDEALVEARRQLRRARRLVGEWRLSAGSSVFAPGLEETAALAARRWRRARDLDGESLHRWRTVSKRWWYQLRLVEAAAPDLIGPLVDRLDDLGEGLGDVHDLDVLVALLEQSTTDDPAATGFLEVARHRRDELAVACHRAASPLFAERPAAHTRRMTSYWDLAAAGAPLAAPSPVEPVPAGRDDHSAGATPPVERERTFLVAEVPPFVTDGARLRQGYLAVEDRLSVRVRSVEGGAATLTVKAGSGRARLELEWEIDDAVFEQLWPLTAGRRIDKVRHVIVDAGRPVEVDVFDGDLAGLVVAEVEFDDDDAMAAYEPLAWMGREVSDDPRYSNARLALDGAPEPVSADEG